jgi:Domain of unknown function (DUF222)/HNH endonuclease
VVVSCTAPPPVAPLAALGADIAALAAEDLDNLSCGALGEDLVALRRHLDRMEAEFARRLRRFDCLHGPAADGAASTTSWLSSRCRLFPGAAAERVTLARHLPDLPQTETALRNGEIGYQHATVIAHTAERIGVEPARSAETILVQAARTLEPARLRLVTRRLEHCVDPDGALRDANHDHDRRRLHLSRTLDGVVVLDGLLDAEGGATLMAAIDALSAPFPGDTRTAAQRRADALVELCTRQMQAGRLPQVAGQRPHLTVTAPEATLRGEPGAPGGELAWAGPVIAETVRRLACDAALTTVTVDSRGEPLVVGRTTRTVPASLRRSLVIRDRGCRFPGCDRPPEWTDGHHLLPWANGGPTTLDNLVLVCRTHHHLVHEGGWRLLTGSDGRLTAIPP